MPHDAVEAGGQGNCDECADDTGHHVRKALATRRRLSEAGFGFTIPEGAYYVLADFSGLSDKDDTAFAKWMAAEVGVAGVPGSSFYHAGAGRGKSMIRFAFCKKQETLDQAAERLSGLTARV